MVQANGAKPDIDRSEDDETRHGFAEVLFESVRGRGESGVASLDTALTSFKGAARTKPYKEQRKAEPLIEIGRAAEPDAIRANRDELETSCWTQRLMARAVLGLDRPNDALEWIDRTLGDEEATEDLRTAISRAPAGPVRERLEAMLEHR